MSHTDLHLSSEAARPRSSRDCEEDPDRSGEINARSGLQTSAVATCDMPGSTAAPSTPNFGLGSESGYSVARKVTRQLPPRLTIAEAYEAESDAAGDDRKEGQSDNRSRIPSSQSSTTPVSRPAFVNSDPYRSLPRLGTNSQRDASLHEITRELREGSAVPFQLGPSSDARAALLRSLPSRPDLTEDFNPASDAKKDLQKSHAIGIEQQVHRIMLRIAAYCVVIYLSIHVFHFLYRRIPSYYTICQSVLGFSPAFCLYGHVPSRMLWPPPKAPVISSEVLSYFDGREHKLPDGRTVQLPIFISVLGQVFDVTRGADHYAPGAPYAFLVGKDASRAFATANFDPDKLRPQVEDLSPTQVFAAHEWLRFYHESDKYSFIGVLDGHYYGPDGKPKSSIYKVERMLRMYALDKERTLNLQSIPECEVKWSPVSGGLLTCPAPEILSMKRRLRQVKQAQKGRVIPPYRAIEEDEYQRLVQAASSSGGQRKRPLYGGESEQGGTRQRRAFPRETDHVVFEGRRIRHRNQGREGEDLNEPVLGQGATSGDRAQEKTTAQSDGLGLMFPVGRSRQRYVIPELIKSAPRYPRRMQYALTSSSGTGLGSDVIAWNEKCVCLTEYQMARLPKLVETKRVTESGLVVEDGDPRATSSGWIKAVPVGGAHDQFVRIKSTDYGEPVDDNDNDDNSDEVDGDENEDENEERVGKVHTSYQNEVTSGAATAESKLEDSWLPGWFRARLLSTFHYLSGKSKSQNGNTLDPRSKVDVMTSDGMYLRYAEYPGCEPHSTACKQPSWSSLHYAYHKQASPEVKKKVNDAMNRMAENQRAHSPRPAQDQETVRMREELRQERERKLQVEREEKLRRAFSEPYAQNIGSWRTLGAFKREYENIQQKANEGQSDTLASLFSGPNQGPTVKTSGTLRSAVLRSDAQLTKLKDNSRTVSTSSVARGDAQRRTTPVNPWA